MIQEEIDIEVIKIDDTDIILQDEGDGRGKITISNSWGYNYSHFWGSMGGSLKEFLLRINEGYFIDKLSDFDDRGVFDGKATMTAVRKHIREEMSYELPWYKYMSAQKELREKFKEMERIEDENSFVDAMSSLESSLIVWDLDR